MPVTGPAPVVMRRWHLPKTFFLNKCTESAIASMFFVVCRYATVDDAIKMVVANKTDLAARRDVSAEEGHDLAKKHG